MARLSHVKLGVSVEGFAIEELIETDKGLIGFEVKYSDAPTMTKSMHIVQQDLKLAHLYVIYPGKTRYLLQENATVLPINQLVGEFSQ